MANKAPVQSDNNKKVLLTIVLALVIVIAGWRILAGMFGRGDEAAAKAVENSVPQVGGPVGAPGIYLQQKDQLIKQMQEQRRQQQAAGQ
jgi:TRAP-type C4-dicarboxylate transport system permease small subunit